MRKKKTKPIGFYKRKAWAKMSLYVRLVNACDDGYAECVTCEKRLHYKKLQGGHFVPKSLGGDLYFHPANVHCQCYRCNVLLKGNMIKYTLYMLDTFGRHAVDDLLDLVGTKGKYSKAYYMGLIEQYDKLLEPQLHKLEK